jgi:hypothetical protein
MLPKKRTDPNADDEVCESEKTFGSSFHLGTLLTQAKGLLERFDRPLVLLIDDIHLLRFGRVLGKMDQELRKLFPRFSIICSAPNAHHIPGFPMPELIELSPPSIDDSIEIVRRNACGGGKKKKLSSDVIGILRNALQKSESNLILGEVQVTRFKN